MKLPTRRFLLSLIIASLSITAVLGIIAVLWAGLGEAGAKILGSAIGVDIASILTLCCTGPAKSALHRAVQVTGILSACLGVLTGLYVIWLASGPGEGMTRTAAVLFLLAAASAHVSGVLAWRTHNRPMRIVTPATILCTAAAAELIANYLVFPGFDPDRGYLRALMAVLILDALGSILLLLLRRFGPPRSETAAAGATVRHPRLAGPGSWRRFPGSAESCEGEVGQATEPGHGAIDGERGEGAGLEVAQEEADGQVSADA